MVPFCFSGISVIKKVLFFPFQAWCQCYLLWNFSIEEVCHILRIECSIYWNKSSDILHSNICFHLSIEKVWSKLLYEKCKVLERLFEWLKKTHLNKTVGSSRLRERIWKVASWYDKFRRNCFVKVGLLDILAYLNPPAWNGQI